MENMQQPRLTFSKGERLCNYHRIQKLFQEGNSLKKYPIKLLYLAVDSQEINNQVLISVPKRKVRRAVHRNRIKRLIRESYRKQKSLLSSSYSLAFVYMGTEEISYTQVSQLVDALLKQLLELSEKA
jgi:ribonuclease P protein component